MAISNNIFLCLLPGTMGSQDSMFSKMTRLHAGWPEFLQNFQNYSRAHSSSYWMGTRAFLLISIAACASGRPLNVNQVRSLRMGGAIPLLPLNAFLACTETTLLSPGTIVKKYQFTRRGNHLKKVTECAPLRQVLLNFPLISVCCLGLNSTLIRHWGSSKTKHTLNLCELIRRKSVGDVRNGKDVKVKQGNEGKRSWKNSITERFVYVWSWILFQFWLTRCR